MHLSLKTRPSCYAFVKLHETGEVRDGHVAKAQVAVGVKIDRHVDKHVASGNNALKNVDQKLLSKTSRDSHPSHPPVRNVLQHNGSACVLACLHFFNINSIFLRSALRSVTIRRSGFLPSIQPTVAYLVGVLRLALLFHAKQSSGGERGVAESRSTHEPMASANATQEYREKQYQNLKNLTGYPRNRLESSGPKRNWVWRRSLHPNSLL